MRRIIEVDFFASSENLVTPVLFIPLCDGRILVHVLNDVAPANAGVVSAETDFTLLRTIRDDAHFGSAEVIVEQILKPHACDEEEVPAVRATLLDVIFGAFAVNATVILARQAEGLVELLEQLVEREVRWRLVRVVMLKKRKPHHDIRHPLAARSVRDLLHVMD